MKQILQNPLKKYCLTVFMFALSATFMFAQNASNGGTISSNQTLCVGETPMILSSQAPASGGNSSLAIEYLWMTTSNVNNNIASWDIAPGNNSGLTYQPAIINNTTYYVRCARRAGFLDFLAESNIVTLSLLPSPTASINGNPNSTFLNGDIDFTASFGGPNSTYFWDFGNGQTSTSQNPFTVNYNAPGTYTVTLTVNNGSCTTTTTTTITVLNPSTANIADPCFCGNPLNFIPPGSLDFYNHDYILINSNPGETWTLTPQQVGGGLFNLVNGALIPIPAGTTIPEASPGVYYLNVWFNGALGGWSGNVSNGTTNLTTGPGPINPCPLCPQAPLPVKLVSFTGEAAANTIELKWATETEFNNSHFEIQKSNDGGERFEVIGEVEGNSTSILTNYYSFVDANPVKGENYFRLKQIDFNGDFEYSEIISVRVDFVNSDLTVSPNPVRETARVELGEFYPNSNLEIISSTGQVVRIIEIANTYQDIFVGDLPNGVYFLRVKSNSFTQNLFHKIIKQ